MTAFHRFMTSVWLFVVRQFVPGDCPECGHPMRACSAWEPAGYDDDLTEVCDRCYHSPNKPR
jgi:hypothetical protein